MHSEFYVAVLQAQGGVLRGAIAALIMRRVRGAYGCVPPDDLWHVDSLPHSRRDTARLVTAAFVTQVLCAVGHAILAIVVASKLPNVESSFDFMYATVQMDESLLVPFNCAFECDNSSGISSCLDRKGSLSSTTGYCAGVWSDAAQDRIVADYDAYSTSPCVASGGFDSAGGTAQRRNGSYTESWSRRVSSYTLEPFDPPTRFTGWLVVVIEAVTSLSHLVHVVFLRRFCANGGDLRNRFLTSGSFPMQWFEYALSATMMQLFVASISNVLVVDTIVAQVCATFSLMLVGHVAENTSHLLRRLAYIYFAGFPLFLAGWFPVIDSVNRGLRRLACPTEVEKWGLACEDPTCFGDVLVGMIRTYTFVLCGLFLVFPVIEVFFSLWSAVPLHCATKDSLQKRELDRGLRTFVYGTGPLLFVVFHLAAAQTVGTPTFYPCISLSHAAMIGPLFLFLYLFLSCCRVGTWKLLCVAAALAVGSFVASVWMHSDASRHEELQLFLVSSTGVVGGGLLLLLLGAWVWAELALQPSLQLHASHYALLRDTRLVLSQLTTEAKAKPPYIVASTSPLYQGVESRISLLLDDGSASVRVAREEPQRPWLTMDALYLPSLDALLSKLIVHAVASATSKAVLVAFFWQLYLRRDW